MAVIQMPMAAALPSPPYAADVRSSGWRFYFDDERLQQSTTWLVTPLHLRPWLLMLWHQSWRQIPSGSLPNDIEQIAAIIGMPIEQFEHDRAALMRKWYLCNDGRWYHPVVSEHVQEMLASRKKTAGRTENWRKRKRGLVDSDVTRDTPGGDASQNPGDASQGPSDAHNRDVTDSLSLSLSLSSIEEPTPDGVGSDFALSAQSPTTTSRRKPKPPKPAPPAFDGENANVFNGRNVLALAATWQLPTPWGDDAESLGWKTKDILHESEKFRQYWTVGKGAGTTRSLRGWRQSWSNWLARAAKEKR
jgi:hypothetical protein